MQYDDYEGWIDTKQLQTISESSFNQLSSEAIILNADLIEYITAPDNLLIPIPLDLLFLSCTIMISIALILILKELKPAEKNQKKA
jgi:hypothetical protein